MQRVHVGAADMLESGCRSILEIRGTILALTLTSLGFKFKTL